MAVHPVLLAAYAVLFIYAENFQLVRPAEVRPPLIVAVVVSAVLLVALALLLRSWNRGALLATGLLIVFFGYGHLAGMSSPDIPRLELLIAWSAFVLGISGLLLLRRDWLPGLTAGLNVVGLVLLAFTFSTILPHELSRPVRAGSDELAPSGLEASRTTQRDIYYLVFDRYGSASSLAAEFGITDNDLYDWLEERGFEVARQAHANYSRTSLSLASVLNLDYLDDVVAQQDPQSRDYEPVHEMIQNNLVARFLREQGYQYIHIGSWFNPTRTVHAASENLESESATEFQAVLDETTALPVLRQFVPAAEEYPYSTPDDEKHVEAARFQFRALQRVIGEPGGPKFVVAHVLLPHDPYTFDAEGRYVPHWIRHDDPVPPQFRAQLEYTNSEIKKIVERLLARPPETRPIIILQADEGPYPTRYQADVYGFDWKQATPSELEMKFGILNSFYLPPEPDIPAEAPQVTESLSSVNTFRLVLDRYFGLDLPFLPDHVYASSSTLTPYNLIEVTERLPGR